MSVPNGEKLATKQDLADMYQGILPYLGGLPEILANKFSKGDLYSTEEKMIGQWYDGKPLYQKVIEGTLDSASSATTTISVSSLNIDKCVFCDGMITKGTTTLFTPYLNDTLYYVCVCYFDDSNHAIKIVSKNMESCPCKIILKYTKTTDSAISIGSDTDYSTEEKIVGTWIDGSPVYQRTITLNSYISFSQKGSWTNIVAISGLTVNKLISCVSMYRGDGSVRNASVFYRVNGGYLQYFQKSDGVFTEYEADTFTIQYTKTS